MVIAAAVDAIRTFTGLKRKKLEKLMEELQTCMKDDNYVKKLKELGYIE